MDDFRVYDVALFVICIPKLASKPVHSYIVQNNIIVDLRTGSKSFGPRFRSNSLKSVNVSNQSHPNIATNIIRATAIYTNTCYSHISIPECVIEFSDKNKNVKDNGRLSINHIYVSPICLQTYIARMLIIITKRTRLDVIVRASYSENVITCFCLLFTHFVLS